MNNKSYKLQIQEYAEKYGTIPSEASDILAYLEEKLALTEKDMAKIEEDNQYAQSIPWDRLQIILPIIPKPSPRPRYSSVSRCFYVSGAAENKKLLRYYLTEKYPMIYTRTKFSLKTYLPTPVNQMSKTEIYRAEQGEIIPVSNPDWDNLGKTYSDMIQKILILNDNIITTGLTEKYYSVKPRVVIDMLYQRGYDSKYNKKKVERSTSYKEAIEMGSIIEVYTDGEDDYWNDKRKIQH